MAYGPFFPGPLVPVSGSVYGSVYASVARRWFCQFSMARAQFRVRRPSGRFFPCPRSTRVRVRVLVRVRVGHSSVVLACFPWRAPSSVHDGRRAVFSRVPEAPVYGSVYSSVCEWVTRRWFWPVFHGARPVPCPTAVGPFFPVSPKHPCTGPCTRPCASGSLVGGFGLFSMARAQFRVRRPSGRFFPCPRSTRVRVRVLVRVRVGHSSVVLACFPWRAPSSVSDGRRAVFSRVPEAPVYGSVYSSVCEWVTRRWFWPVFHGARPVPSPTAVGPFFPVSPKHPCTGPCTRPCASGSLVGGFGLFSMARAQFRVTTAVGPFFPVSPKHPCTGPCTRPCASGSLVGGFGLFSMARAQFRVRRPSGRFFPCPRSTRVRVRVLVRVRVGHSSVVLACFPWRAPSSVSDGRRAVFSRVPEAPVYGSVYSSVCEWVTRRWFWPVFHGARPVPCPTAVGPFFPVSPKHPCTGPCTRPCASGSLVGGFGLFSMARAQFRVRRPSGRFFPCPRSTRVRVRVLVRVRVGHSSVVLACFPWRAPSSVPTAVGPFFPVSPKHPCTGPCTRPCASGSLVGGFGLFSMARAQFRVRRPSGRFFPCPRSTRVRVRVLVRVRVGHSSVVLACFPWRAPSSVSDGRRAVFSRVPEAPVYGSVYSSVCEWVTRRWFWPVFHGARPVPCPTAVGPFFPVSPKHPCTGPCTRPCASGSLVGGFGLFSMARAQFRVRRPSGRFFPCLRPSRFCPVYSSVAASVARRWLHVIQGLCRFSCP